MEDQTVFLKDSLKEILALFDFKEDIFSIELKEDVFYSTIKEIDNIGVLIGYHGQTLESLEFLLSLMLFYRTNKWQRVIIEIGDYRQKKEEYLKDIIEKALEKTSFLKEPVSLSPMTSKDRRFVHVFLQDNDIVETESQGEGIERHVVIKLKDDHK